MKKLLGVLVSSVIVLTTGCQNQMSILSNELPISDFKTESKEENKSFKIMATQNTLSNITYQNQYDLPTSYAVQNSACAPTTLAMELKRRGLVSNVSSTALDLYKKFGTTSGSGTDRYKISSALKSAYGIDSSYKSASFNDIVDQIDRGLGVPFRSYSIRGLTGGHWILIAGYNSSSKSVYVFDPAFRNGNGSWYSWSTISTNDPGMIYFNGIIKKPIVEIGTSYPQWKTNTVYSGKDRINLKARAEFKNDYIYMDIAKANDYGQEIGFERSGYVEVKNGNNLIYSGNYSANDKILRTGFDLSKLNYGTNNITVTINSYDPVYRKYLVLQGPTLTMTKK